MWKKREEVEVIKKHSLTYLDRGTLDAIPEMPIRCKQVNIGYEIKLLMDFFIILFTHVHT